MTVLSRRGFVRRAPVAPRPEAPAPIAVVEPQAPVARPRRTWRERWRAWQARRGTMRTAKVTALFDESTRIEGRCTFTGTVLFDGTFRGEITSTGTLIIGARGVVAANLQVDSLMVSGQLAGDVQAAERIELCRGARVAGNLVAPVVVVEAGATFEGHCRVLGLSRSEPARETALAPVAAR